MLDTLKPTLIAQIQAAETTAAIEEVRIALLGKKGILTEQLKSLGQLPAEQRREKGLEINALKAEIVAVLEQQQHHLAAAELAAQLARETVDVSLPCPPQRRGSIHPVSQVMDELAAIFGNLGFSAATGPNVEDDFHNFTALNIPAQHPARQMHDTFYLRAPLEDGSQPVLRTHTSPVQIRAMKTRTPPLKIIAMGRTYRSDSDATHTPMFHQIEGLVIDKYVHMGHLKGCLQQFLQAFFGVETLPMRLRPSYFPFTEPSAEVDIGCSRTHGQLQIGAGDGWLEILGCGMVHPNVLRAGGINPDEWQGFAFGMGIERLAMLKYGIADLRTFFDGDSRWHHHYGFEAFSLPSVILRGHP